VEPRPLAHGNHAFGDSCHRGHPDCRVCRRWRRRRLLAIRQLDRTERHPGFKVLDGPCLSRGVGRVVGREFVPLSRDRARSRRSNAQPGFCAAAEHIGERFKSPRDTSRSPIARVITFSCPDARSSRRPAPAPALPCSRGRQVIGPEQLDPCRPRPCPAADPPAAHRFSGRRAAGPPSGLRAPSECLTARVLKSREPHCLRPHRQATSPTQPVSHASRRAEDA
jgi:hypothetical protein